MHETVRLRRATRADADAIADLHTESWRTAYRGIVAARHLGAALANERRRHWRATLAQTSAKDVVLMAEAGSQLVGFVAIWAAAASQPAYIDNLHVRPSRKRSGIGRRLLIEAAQLLLAAGQRSAYLWVFRENHNAVRFYRRCCGVVTRHAFLGFTRTRAARLRITWRDLRLLTRQRV